MAPKKTNFIRAVVFLIEVLLLTNFWVFIYNHLLSFLNSKFPPLGINNFILPGAAPEPFEIPLYLGLTISVIIFLYFIHKKNGSLFEFLDRIKETAVFNIILFFIFGWLLLIFYNSLGGYPMGKDLFPLVAGEIDLTNRIYLLSYLAISALIIFESNWLIYLINKKHFFLIFNIILIGLIGLLTFRANFPISWHDYPYIFGPAFEIAHGKTIYTQVQSQYGFLSIIFLAVLDKLSLLNLVFLPIFIWFLGILQYFFCFYIIYNLSRSFALAFIGLFSILTVNYYSLCCNVTFPQIGAFRWLPIVFLVFLFYKIKKIDSYWLIFILSLVSFWIIDVGMAVLLAYSFTLLIMALVRIISFKRLIKTYFLLVSTIVGIFLFIDLVNVVFGYQLINALSIFTKIQEYSRAGFGMLPMTTKTYFWLMILVYVASLVYFFQQKQRHLEDQLLLFSANLALFASVYFVGRSHPLNLFTISIFFLMTFFILISRLFTDDIFKKSFFLRQALVIILFFVFVAVPAYARKEMLTVNLKEEVTKIMANNQIFNSGAEAYLTSFYGQEKNLIDKYLPDQRIFILSSDDTYLLYLTGKSSLLKINPLTSMISKTDIDFGLQDLSRICPVRIAVDCQIYDRCQPYSKLNLLQYPYTIVLDRLEKECHSKYQPTICTDKICIAKKLKVNE